MNSSLGRALRMLLGTLMAWYGVQMNNIWGYILAILGLVPFFAGMFNLCLIAPLFDLPISGRKMKKLIQEHQNAHSPE